MRASVARVVRRLKEGRPYVGGLFARASVAADAGAVPMHPTTAAAAVLYMV